MIPYNAQSPSGYKPHKPTKEHCEQYVDHEIHITTNEGHTYQAILIDVDINQITILVPEEIDNHESMNRQFGYGYYPPRYRRYRRLFLPLAGLAALSLLPFAAYPYYPYPYPYF